MQKVLEQVGSCTGSSAGYLSVAPIVVSTIMRASGRALREASPDTR